MKNIFCRSSNTFEFAMNMFEKLDLKYQDLLKDPKVQEFINEDKNRKKMLVDDAKLYNGFRLHRLKECISNDDEVPKLTPFAYLVKEGEAFDSMRRTTMALFCVSKLHPLTFEMLLKAKYMSNGIIYTTLKFSQPHSMYNSFIEKKEIYRFKKERKIMEIKQAIWLQSQSAAAAIIHQTNLMLNTKSFQDRVNIIPAFQEKINQLSNLIQRM